VFLFVNFTEEMQVEVKLDGKDYVKAYSDNNTSEYNQLADDFCGKVGIIH